MNKKIINVVVSAVALLLITACNKTPNSETMTMPNTPSSVSVADVDVTTNVKVALANEPVLKGFDIDVITTKGDVRLIGVVDNQSQIDMAIKLAKQAEGTHAIHDELSLTQ